VIAQLPPMPPPSGVVFTLEYEKKEVPSKELKKADAELIQL
jgi:hypothetical protein